MFEKDSYHEYRSYLFDLKKRDHLISDSFDELIEKGSCDELCNDKKFTKDNFIHLLALYNINDYREGGAGAHDDKQTDQGYSNTPLKFIEEFLQNADDCEYTEKPEIEISLDQTRNTIEFVYNEIGFTRADIISLTARDKSTKVGLTNAEYHNDGIFYLRKTGRKGTGFKSVFSIDAENVIVHIRSNGFSFRLDRKIGRTIPIIEADSCIEGKTCIKVELINAKDPLNTVFERIKKIFCITDHYSFFRDNPLMFLRKIRTVSVKNICGKSGESFSLSVDYTNRKYDDKLFTVDPEFEIESGIRNKSGFVESSFEHFNISVFNNDVSVNEIKGFRYSKMVDINDRYYVISVMTPFIKDDLQKWNEGSLFTTLPIIEHKFSLPYAIDAPFDLNDVRKALNYKNADYNNTILKKIFSENGIMSEFLLKLAKVPDIRMDYYIKSKEVKIFNDDIDANHDSDRKRYIPVIDINKPLKNIPVLHKYYNFDEYVDYNSAVRIEKEFYRWPDSEELINFLISDKCKENVISDIYMDSELEFKNADNSNFVNAVNEYLDIVEAKYGLQSETFLDLLNTHIYPYLIAHYSDKPDILKQLKINVWEYYDGENKIFLREEYHEHAYIESKDEKYNGLCSFGKYRLWNSSVLDPKLTEQLLKKYFSVKDIYCYFGEKNINSTAKNIRHWEDVLIFIQTAVYYKADISKLSFRYCKGFCVPLRYDDEYNPYREADVYEEIPESDIETLNRCFGCTANETVDRLKKMCLGMPESFFKSDDRGRMILTDETKKLLSSSDEILSETFKLMDAELSETRDKLDVRPEELDGCSNKAYLYFIKQKNYYIGDTYQDLCDDCQNNKKFWYDTIDLTVSEILLRSLINSKKEVNNPRDKELCLNIKDIIEYGWIDLVFKLLEEKKYSFITILNNGYFEEKIPEEILSLIHTLAPEKAENAKGIKFYAGNLGNTEKKYLNDGDSVYFNQNNDGDICDSLIEYLGTKYDKKKIEIIQEMSNQYADVYREIIRPALDESKSGDFEYAYNSIEEKYRFGEIENRDMINILSWFRYNGSAAAFGNGNISRQKQIADEYESEPWRFVYEFIQNVDDCSFKNKHPELDVNIDEDQNRIIFRYNEDGFTFEDIKALTQFGASEKKEKIDELYVEEGVFDLKPTGEKGIGFKSVFSLPGENIVVHIRSNSFSFKFVKKLGVIVPIWEDDDKINSPGTQIIIEGFNDKTIDSFYDKLKEILGFKADKDLFAVCPVFFLRKLRKISVSNGSERCTFDMDSEIISVGDKSECELLKAKCGIVYDGQLYKKMTERMKINITGINQPVMAVKVSEYLNEGMHDHVLSALAPVITDESECIFEGGSLYTTLPLSRNRISVPVAFNTKFKLNDDRSAVADDKESMNERLSKIMFSSLIYELYTELAHTEGIRIKNYIPKQNNVLFGNEAYKYISEVDIYNIISKIPVLKLYSGNGYISISKALVLPKECYEWARPDLIVKVFDKPETDILALSDYCDIKRIRRAKIVNDSFVYDVNSYLESLTEDERIHTLENYIYDYIMNNKDVQERFSDKKTELSKLNILCFSMADGSTVRESIAAEGRYIVNGSSLKSCGIIRTVSSSVVKLKDEFLTWISGISEIKDIDKLFSELNNNKFKYADSKQTVSELLCMLIYYGYELDGKIKYLRKCALEAKLDGSYNVFRETFIKTDDKRILREIITEDDILAIAIDLSEYGVFDDKADPEYIINVIKKMGAKKSNDYFDFKDGVRLHTSALAVLERNSDNQEFTEKLLTDIASQKIKGINELNIIYEDICKCSEYVIISIVKNEIIKPSYLYDLSRKYIEENFINCRNADKAEALLRCFAVCDEKIYPDDEDAVVNIEIKLSDIISRKLGNVLQKAYLEHSDEISLKINTDGAVLTEYPKEDINEVIKWMDKSEESVLSDVQYEYYECDISQAFIDTDEMFLFDKSRVILNNSIPENNMLYFVQRRFKGKAEKYQIMLSIRTGQNTLQNWNDVNKTKEEYINALHDYREANQKVLEDLCPDIEDIYRSSTDDAVEYVIPELLQNINDCKKGDNESQRILSVDIDDNYMILKYQEKGFDYKNVYSITSIGKSTKNDSSEGEKGLGFKKVFSVFEEVEIYSNGFCFKLSHEERTINNTVPVWINDQKKREKYLADGYTTMRMRVKKNRNNDLKRLKKTWENIFSGEYGSGTVSPLFLSNIDGYELNGQENRISRYDIEKGYYYKNINIYDTYRELLGENGSSSEEIESSSEKLIILLEDRRKKRGMNDDEFRNYVKSLSLSICVPRKLDKNYSGRFYSTLPTNNKTGIAVNINIPLELTTGRDAIDKNSKYNKKLIGFLFDTPDTEISLFSFLLKKVSEEKNGIDLINYIEPDIDLLIYWAYEITKDINVDIRHSIKRDLRNIPMLNAAGKENMISLDEGFCLDYIANKFINNDPKNSELMQNWLFKNTEIGRKYDFVMASSEEKYEKLLKLAEHTAECKDRYPYTEEGELLLKFFDYVYGER